MPYSPTGRQIVTIRPMTDAELVGMDWSVFPGSGRPIVLVLDDGGLIFAASDPEYNDFGVLNVRAPNGDDLTLHATVARDMR